MPVSLISERARTGTNGHERARTVLFLLYINDLPDVVVHSTARLFADDCIVYRPIRNNDDTTLLQNDLNKIAEWEFMWQMQFNIDKCFVLRVGRPKHKLRHLYTLHNQNLSETDCAKYLGVTITSDLQWNQHINNITNKANSILGLLRRNLRIPSQTIKTHAYQSLVRPHLEYASTVWDPHTQKNIYKLDIIQPGFIQKVESQIQEHSRTFLGGKQICSRTFPARHPHILFAIL